MFNELEDEMSGTQLTDSLRRFDASQGPRKIGPADGHLAELGGCDARFLVWGEESGGNFSLVEHPIPPRSLCAPLHRHDGVDEYSFVLEGRMGALLGDEVIYAEAGDLAFKPRDQWHTFWNAGDEPCRILEVISPGGFEHFFREFDEMTKSGDFSPETLSERYGIEFDMESVPRICAEHGLTHPLLG
ncbi:MAG TPA: cupin domain-containing protein [Solirubrobacterales bacterium]|nr:cupin domain-containing protein [Solirubrobacterales bacterium]